MGGIYSSAHIEVYICCFLEKESADKSGTVTIEAPLLVKFIFAEIILGIFEYLVYGYYALGNKIYTFDFSNRGDITFFKVECCFERLAEVLCRNCRCSTAAYNVLSFL